MPPSSAPPECVVALSAVRKAFGQGAAVSEVLRGVNLTVRRGECIFLVGPSGSGKSTLLSILGCLVTPDSGRVSILGQDVAALTNRQRSRLRRDRIGFVFQRFHLVRGLSALDNVCLPLTLSGAAEGTARRRGRELLAEVGLGDRCASDPRQMSAGQCQRIALARALAADPDLVLADEPTASLDAASGEQAMEILHSLVRQQGRTAIVVTHDPRIFRYADRILRLDREWSQAMRLNLSQPISWEGRPNMLKYLITALGLTIIAGLTMLIEKQSRPEVRPAPPLPPSTVIYATGRVAGAGEPQELRPRLSGRVARILVTEGQQVEAGQLILELEDDELEAECAAAAAAVHVAQVEFDRLQNGCRQEEQDEAKALWEAKQAELNLATLEWNRTSQLHGSSAATRQEADRDEASVKMLTALVSAAKSRWELLEAPAREDDLQIAEAKLKAAQAQLALAETTCSLSSLKALQGGQVLQVEAQVGEILSPECPLPALVLCDVRRLQVRAYVEEFDALRVQVGMPAKITSDGLPQAIEGVVSRLAPRMTSKDLWSDEPDERYDTKVREVWIELPEGSHLIHGLRVDVAIETNRTSTGPQPVNDVPHLSVLVDSQDALSTAP